jgi:hypothetical protein
VDNQSDAHHADLSIGGGRATANEQADLLVHLPTQQRTKRGRHRRPELINPKFPGYDALAEGAEMLRTDILSKAEECARAIEATNDRGKREALRHLQQLWIALADGGQVFADTQLLAIEIAEVDRIHAVVMAAVMGSAASSDTR